MDILKLLEREGYINVEEIIFLEDRLNFLMAIWKDIILTNSDKRLFELKENQIEAINQYITEFKFMKVKVTDRININKFDSSIVYSILDIAIKLNKVTVIDAIFKRTKSAAKAMPQYFYPIEIINAYIELLDIDKAKSVLEYIGTIDHKSYWYKIVDINKSDYKDYPEFYKKLRQMQYECYSKLIKAGETIEINLDLEMLKGINQYI